MPTHLIVIAIVIIIIIITLSVAADFHKGKTVFKHWLPGTCYTNITFQLISEATVNRSSLVSRSPVLHEPQQHRTGTSLRRSASVSAAMTG